MKSFLEKYIPNLIAGKLFFLVFFLFLISFGIYFPSLGYEFTFDDYIQVVKNEYVRSSDNSLQQIFSVFTQATIPGDLYRPVSLLTLRLNNFIADGISTYFHLVNLFLNSAVVLLCFWVVLIFSKNRWIAFLSALLFAVHPVHIEAVVNIYNRTEVVAALFALLSLIASYYYIERKNFIHFVFAGLCFFLAALSKESTLTFLGIIPLFIMFAKKSYALVRDKNFLCLFSFLAILSVAYIVLRLWVLQEGFLVSAPTENYHAENAVLQYSFFERIWPGLYILGEYIRLLVLPIALAADYSFPEKFFTSVMNSSYGTFSAITGLSLFVILIVLSKKREVFWGLWVFLSLSITLNVIVVIGTLMAERLLYLPSLGYVAFIVSIGFLFWKYEKYRPLLTAFFLAYFIFLTARTVTRMPVWKDNQTLFFHTVQDNSQSSKAFFVKGILHHERGEYEDAVSCFKEALFRDPSVLTPAKFLVGSYLKQGKYRHAKYWTQKYLELEEDPLLEKLMSIYEQQERNKE